MSDIRAQIPYYYSRDCRIKKGKSDFRYLEDKSRYSRYLHWNDN